VPGSETVSAGTWTVTGGGGDIWGTGDQFRFDYQSLPGDGSISAQVLSQTTSNSWAKAGVMLRTGTGRAMAFYDLLVTPGHGFNVEYRSGKGATALKQTAIPGNPPVYLRVSRSGTTFSSYTSADGVSWTLVPGSAATLTGLSGPLLAGLAVTAHNLAGSSTVVYSSVGVSAALVGP
jgi:hypothetical protein